MFNMVSHGSEALGNVAATPECRSTTNNVVLQYMDRKTEREKKRRERE
jgi:hypothetical protein